MLFSKLWLRRFLVALGATLSLSAIGSYSIVGFRSGLVLMLILGLAFFGVGFSIGPKLKINWRVARLDVLIAAGLLLFFGTLYTYHAYDFPHQMNEDEITIMTFAKEAATKPGQDILGPSTYFGFPLFIFWVLGKTGIALGGVTLANMRTVHALSGALIIVFSFGFFRLCLERTWALTATLILATNHSLFFISRLAMRDNTALLFEIAALVLLTWGWQQRHKGITFVGGVAAGLTFYTYYPSRMTLIIWVGSIIGFSALKRFSSHRQLIPLVLIALLGASLTAAPVFIGSYKSPDKNSFYDSAFLFTKSGREAQQKWVFAKTEKEGVYINIRQGLLAFNKPFTDEGYIYNHPGFGFVDSATGILIWLGLGAVLIGAIRSKRNFVFVEVLMVTGFLITWLSLALVINKAPDYTRMLITLPFVAYFAARALKAAVEVAKKIVRLRFKLVPAAVGLAGLSIVVWNNVAIAADYYKLGLQDSTGTSNTVRYMDIRQASEPAKWYIAPSSPTSYFSWGGDENWKYWLSFFSRNEAPIVIHQPDFSALIANPPQPGVKGYLFTNKEVWANIQDWFPYHVIEQSDITPDGRLVVVKFE